MQNRYENVSLLSLASYNPDDATLGYFTSLTYAKREEILLKSECIHPWIHLSAAGPVYLSEVVLIISSHIEDITFRQKLTHEISKLSSPHHGMPPTSFIKKLIDLLLMLFKDTLIKAHLFNSNDELGFIRALRKLLKPYILKDLEILKLCAKEKDFYLLIQDNKFSFAHTEYGNEILDANHLKGLPHYVIKRICLVDDLVKIITRDPNFFKYFAENTTEIHRDVQTLRHENSILEKSKEIHKYSKEYFFELKNNSNVDPLFYLLILDKKCKELTVSYFLTEATEKLFKVIENYFQSPNQYELSIKTCLYFLIQFYLEENEVIEFLNALKELFESYIDENIKNLSILDKALHFIDLFENRRFFHNKGIKCHQELLAIFSRKYASVLPYEKIYPIVNSRCLRVTVNCSVNALLTLWLETGKHEETFNYFYEIAYNENFSIETREVAKFELAHSLFLGNVVLSTEEDQENLTEVNALSRLVDGCIAAYEYLYLNNNHYAKCLLPKIKNILNNDGEKSPLSQDPGLILKMKNNTAFKFFSYYIKKIEDQPIIGDMIKSSLSHTQLIEALNQFIISINMNDSEYLKTFIEKIIPLFQIAKNARFFLLENMVRGENFQKLTACKKEKVFSIIELNYNNFLPYLKARNYYLERNYTQSKETYQSFIKLDTISKMVRDRARLDLAKLLFHYSDELNFFPSDPVMRAIVVYHYTLDNDANGAIQFNKQLKRILSGKCANDVFFADFNLEKLCMPPETEMLFFEHYLEHGEKTTAILGIMKDIFKTLSDKAYPKSNEASVIQPV